MTCDQFLTHYFSIQITLHVQFRFYLKNLSFYSEVRCIEFILKFKIYGKLKVTLACSKYINNCVGTCGNIFVLYLRQNEFPVMQHVTVFLNFIIRINKNLLIKRQNRCTHFTCVFNQSSLYSVAGCQEVCATIFISKSAVSSPRPTYLCVTALYFGVMR